MSFLIEQKSQVDVYKQIHNIHYCILLFYTNCFSRAGFHIIITDIVLIEDFSFAEEGQVE